MGRRKTAKKGRLALRPGFAGELKPAEPVAQVSSKLLTDGLAAGGQGLVLSLRVCLMKHRFIFSLGKCFYCYKRKLQLCFCENVQGSVLVYGLQ